ncbi:MAG TPA: hypothetical protein VMH30_09855 [Verrucomicrobiae bacterium]|nr:hypothetical protein [Verrucomicrobiae bacterium]
MELDILGFGAKCDHYPYRKNDCRIKKHEEFLPVTRLFIIHAPMERAEKHEGQKNDQQTQRQQENEFNIVTVTHQPQSNIQSDSDVTIL